MPLHVKSFVPPLKADGRPKLASQLHQQKLNLATPPNKPI
jgi:hypothetical protein